MTQQQANILGEITDFLLSIRARAKLYQSSIRSKTTCLNELRHHILRKNHARLFRTNTLSEQERIRRHSTRAVFHDHLANDIIVGVNVVIAPLLFVWGARAEFRRHMKRRKIVDIPATDFIPRKAYRVAKPLAGHPDRHLQPKPRLRVEERADVVVIREILDEFCVLLCEFSYLLSERNTSCIDNRQIIPERLQEFSRRVCEHLLCYIHRS